MDLAESIRENTKALQSLTAILERALASPVTLNPVSEGAVSEAPAAGFPGDATSIIQGAEKYSAPAAEKPAKPAKPAKPKDEPKAPAVTLDDAKAAATALVKKDRDALVALLAEYDAPKVVSLKPEQFAGFTAQAKARLAELETAAA